MFVDGLIQVHFTTQPEGTDPLRFGVEYGINLSPEQAGDLVDALLTYGARTPGRVQQDQADADHPDHVDCADGCGLDVTHDGPCLDKPGGRVVCSDENHEE